MNFFNQKKNKKSEPVSVKAKEKKHEAVEEVAEVVVEASPVEFIGEGPLSGEYRFKGIRGSIAASSKEEAIKKANEIAAKHPRLLDN